MAEHPIQGLMNVTMEKIHQMVDSNTIIGKPIITEDGTTILPVSTQKYSCIFADNFSAVSNLTTAIRRRLCNVFCMSLRKSSVTSSASSFGDTSAFLVTQI